MSAGKKSDGLEMPLSMRASLRPHQISALEFLWKRLVLDGILRVSALSYSSTIEQRTRLSQEIFGAVLGHSMGLGKTLTSLTFALLLHAQMQMMVLKRERMQQLSNDQRSSTAGGGSQCPALRVLILCPRSCVMHWQTSIAEWVTPVYCGSVRLSVHVPSDTTAAGRSQGTSDDVHRFYRNGGILLMGYEEYLRALQMATAQYRDAPATTWPRVWSLIDSIRLRLPLSPQVRLLDMLEGADLVILDEAHRLRRSSSQLVASLTDHLRNIQLRVALTGTPLQNHLEEYNTMQAVVTGNELNTQLFQKHFIAPIERGQCVDSNSQQFLEMQRCVASLRRYFLAVVHHRGPEVLEESLPPRHELIFFFRLSPAQDIAYRRMLLRFQQDGGSAEKGGLALQLHHIASRLCLHPSLEDSDSGAVATDAPLVKTVDPQSDEGSEDDAAESLAPQSSVPKLLIEDSPKLFFAVALILYITRHLQEKVVVFSQYRSNLRLVAALLQQRCVACRVLTGDSTGAERRRYVEDFQLWGQYPVLLCSVRAGGVGIQLSAANHCILLDVSWNPADDSQATYRVYRYGQTRPVQVYRLATWGTSEHVVFAYALQKSWLHRKVADVTDPSRQQRHRTRSYFRYPCGVPLPDGAILTTAEDMAGQDPTAIPEEPLWMKRCADECPAAAEVLSRHNDLSPFLHAIIPQANLLQHNGEDVIREMSRRFEEVDAQKKSQMPIPLHSGMTTSSSTGASRQRGQDERDLLATCETALVDAARQAAHHLIVYALNSVDGRRSANETESTVRSADQAFCHLLSLLLQHHSQQPQQQKGQPAPLANVPARSLSEVVLQCYQSGARRVLQPLFRDGSYMKMRMYLMSRLPPATRRRWRDGSGPSENPLEDAFQYSPFSLLSTIDPVEVTYLLTELGCDRPLFGTCVVRGLAALWREDSSFQASDAALLRQLSSMLHWDVDGEGAAALSSPVDLSFPSFEAEADPRDPNGIVFLSRQVLDKLSAVFDDLWPPYEGFALPPMELNIAEETRQMGRAYRHAANVGTTVGLFTIAQVADFLKLPLSQKGRGFFGCARCRGPTLRRVDESHLECPSCHYNVEFEVRVNARLQQQSSLYQLSKVCSLLDSFSISKTFAVCFSPADYSDTIGALQSVSGSRAVFNFISQAMEEGVRVMVEEFPPMTINLLGIQIGAGPDMDALQRILLANGCYAYQTYVRRHVQERVAQSFSDFVSPSKLAKLSGMPLMPILAALYYAARNEGLLYAHELLEDGWKTPNRRLLLFASDALVKIRYVERLLEYCREKPEPPPPKVPLAEAAATDAPPPNARSLLPLLTMSSSSSSEDAVSAERSSSSRSQLHGSSSASCSSSSPSSRTGSVDSSVYSCYSKDRESFKDVESRKVSPTISEDGASIGSWVVDLIGNGTAFNGSSTAQQLEGEEVLQRRSGQYWVAYCEVYGTHRAETSSVAVEDETHGTLFLSEPPLSFWVSHVAPTSVTGMRVDEMLDNFVDRLLKLSTGMRLVS